MKPRQEFYKAVSEIKSPEARLNIWMLVLAILALVPVIVFVYKDRSDVTRERYNNLQDEVIYLKDQTAKKDIIINYKDSVIIQRRIEQDETIEKLNYLIETQNGQKKLLRTRNP